MSKCFFSFLIGDNDRCKTHPKLTHTSFAWLLASSHVTLTGILLNVIKPVRFPLLLLLLLLFLGRFEHENDIDDDW